MRPWTEVSGEERYNGKPCH